MSSVVYAPIARMTLRRLIARSLRFHLRSHIGVVLGAAVGSAALTGALVVGDSVRASLRERALERLDNTWFALAPADRFFRRDLALNIRRKPGAAISSVFPPGSQRLFLNSVPLLTRASLLSLRGTIYQSTSGA